MKKMIAVVLLILITLLIFFLQVNLFNVFNISGIKPNLFIVLTVLIGLFIGNKKGVIFGCLAGVFIDSLTNERLGSTSLMLASIGFFGEVCENYFSKDNKITIMLTVASSTIIYEIGMYLMKIIKYNIIIELIQFLKIMIIEAVYNVLLVIILYPIIKSVGKYIEENMKKKDFFKRYSD